jgi:pimeloyl-ACP methyl ester carboxylesterase
MTGRTVRVKVGDIELDVIEAGDPAGRCVVLAHGFPESAHSWRHQIPALADAGYHVLAPDQRGYARSSAPTDIGAYGIEHLCGDLIGVIEHFGHDTAVFVGHDWGALVVWDLARLHPPRCDAVVGMSVPLTVWPMRPTDLFRAAFGDDFFYMLYFQQVGPPERELEADIDYSLRTVLWGASGEGHRDDPRPRAPMVGTGFLDTFDPPPSGLPRWITEQEFSVYVEQFRHSGFFGPVSWYRNLDANFERTVDIPTAVMTMPTLFVGGTKDGVIADRLEAAEESNALAPHYRGSVLIPDAGHWVQQEAPEAVNTALLAFLRAL